MIDDRISCRVCALATNRVCSTAPVQGLKLVQSIINPLLTVIDGNSQSRRTPLVELVSPEEKEILSDENQIDMAVKVLHDLVLGAPMSPLLLQVC